MILVKPKVGTLFSIGLFILICLAGGIYGFMQIRQDVHAAWYHYVLALVLLPLGIGLLLKILWGYQYVSFGKQRIKVEYPIRRKTAQYNLNMITAWREESVKTASGQYKEIVIQFTNGRKIRISMQEHIRYKEAVKYLNKKARTKFKS
jgi:hypothetical protein